MSTHEANSFLSQDEEEEDQSEYKPGGYHPVQIGERYLNRYTIIQKLGWGQFSTVWLAKDNVTNSYVALKIQKSSYHYTEAAMDEINILIKTTKSYEDPVWLRSLEEYSVPYSQRGSFVVQLLSHFVHKGKNGKHICMIFELLGVNLLEIVKLYEYKGIPIPLVRTIARQVLIGLDYLHRICGVIHTDIKPENILLQLTQAQLSDLINKRYFANKFPYELPSESPIADPSIELGHFHVDGVKKVVKRRRYSKRPCGEELEEETQARSKSVHSEDSGGEHAVTSRRRKSWNFDRDIVKTKPRLRENLMVKIADLGNACFGKKHFSSVIQTRQYRSPEVILGIKYGFSADIWSFGCMVIELITGEFLFEPSSGEDYSKNSDHLAQMWEALGNFPVQWARKGKRYNKYFTSKGKLRNIDVIRIWLLKDILIQKYRIIPSEAESICDFVKGMLTFQPGYRSTARECLENKWLYQPPVYEYYLSEEEHAKYVSEEEAKERAGTAYVPGD